MYSNKLIWILEDDEECLFVYQRILSLRYSIECFKNLEELEEALKNDIRPDLLVADLLLPDGSFMNWFESAPARLRNLNFIVVSSVDDQDALFKCYERGAHDYLIKPFNKNELIVKVYNALHRPHGFFYISQPEQKKLLEELTAKESKILSIIFENGGRASREEIVSKVWNSINVHPKTLDVHLTNIRKKLMSRDMTLQIYDGQWVLSGHVAKHGINMDTQKAVSQQNMSESSNQV